MKIAVASGKGGTGKTTIAVNLALAIGDCLFVDCDVEEPNAHIFLKPEITETSKVTIDVPLIKKESCTNCGICSEACHFNALIALPKKVLLHSELCISCKACLTLCPENAIIMMKKEIGVIHQGKSKRDITFMSGLLDIGIPRAIPIIEKLKEKSNKFKNVIYDAPPGNSCLVIETIRDSDYCLFVTEPTPFGLWDLKIAVKVARLFDLNFGVLINRSGMGDDSLIEQYCEDENIDIVMKIPYDRSIAEAYSQGIPLVDIDKTYSKKFLELVATIQSRF